MRIVFVRHGHPNYELDCLTELGNKQAKAAAVRLKDEKIEKIYTSTCGRARETAEHTANVLGIPAKEIIPCDFMREIAWASFDGTNIYKNGNPWDNVALWEKEGKDVTDACWYEKEPFDHSKIIESNQNVSRDIDIWLEELGYKRDGPSYRIIRKNEATVAMFSHGGSSSLALAHMFNIPTVHFISMIQPDFTAITVVSFDGEDGELTVPRFEVVNDSRHIAGIELE